MEWPRFEARTSSITWGRSFHSTTPHLALKFKWTAYGALLLGHSWDWEAVSLHCIYYALCNVLHYAAGLYTEELLRVNFWTVEKVCFMYLGRRFLLAANPSSLTKTQRVFCTKFSAAKNLEKTKARLGSDSLGSDFLLSRQAKNTALENTSSKLLQQELPTWTGLFRF